eukprot:TRINITY_DN32365_c0_g1_i1.p1 TRINITY_DN32365_c0_g1~~TRINITY_DN32365_c0_g1_i1.p1  ORF type:complete len:190 (+),score=15.44 TRINITY_DN32365_c0_g1_i1:84-653(+)
MAEKGLRSAGVCKNGRNCRFAHGLDELRQDFRTSSRSSAEVRASLPRSFHSASQSGFQEPVGEDCSGTKATERCSQPTERCKMEPLPSDHARIAAEGERLDPLADVTNSTSAFDARVGSPHADVCSRTLGKLQGYLYTPADDVSRWQCGWRAHLGCQEVMVCVKNSFIEVKVCTEGLPRCRSAPHIMIM